jgi:phenylpyruvate tautomerase PptA (4-oxalocrotonate tautomerase family)
MPVIKVWCLPEQTEEQLQALHKNLVSAVVSVTELGLKDENEMTMLFPPDAMKYGLGSEIIVEVSSLFEGPKRTDEVRQKLAENIGRVIQNFFPDALVECFIYPFKPSQGFWSSKIG